ncbi:DUF2325 domain-containing protein [Janthinobacterium sp. LB2P10]|uniref:DUF2325 domain-containing protein n=1 Tax=Janthinobacterium sp. LB2P10 TaxID=3424194 RepID=UPI000B25CB02
MAPLLVKEGMMGSVYGNEDLIAHEHRVLMGEYGRAQARCSAQLAAQAARIAQLESALMRARVQVVIRDTQLALARDELAELAASMPGLPTRARLARRVEWLGDRVQDLMRELLRLQWLPVPGLQADLREKAVLYVGSYFSQDTGQAMGQAMRQDMGQATGAAHMAQHAVEQAGGRFLHHAGGDAGADDAAALEAGLVAADLVICQTGCVSHDAYWRVHDHCKRTGKQCVLLDQPHTVHAIHFVRKQSLLA